MITFLLDEGANIEALEKDSSTPLHLAVASPVVKIDGALRALLQKNARTDAKNRL